MTAASLLDDDHTQYQKESEKGIASGYASLNASIKVVEQPASISDHLATASEVNTGSDATKAVSPDSLAGSIFGEKIAYLKVIAETTALTTGDGKMYFTVPDSLNGMNLVDADAAVYTVSSSGTPTVQINNLDYAGGAQDMLSTLITIDASEYNSYTATAPPVINTSYDDVATGNRLRIDVDVAGTGTTGLDVILTFQLP
jgi:hypothetical protein